MKKIILKLSIIIIIILFITIFIILNKNVKIDVNFGDGSEYNPYKLIFQFYIAVDTMNKN